MAGSSGRKKSATGVSLEVNPTKVRRIFEVDTITDLNTYLFYLAINVQELLSKIILLYLKVASMWLHARMKFFTRVLLRARFFTSPEYSKIYHGNRLTTYLWNGKPIPNE